ncbi:MAG: three-Cys-motif partner protein TcmP [Dehalococcoidia bacterium]
MAIIREDYKGKEQSFIKHILLHQYLVKLFMIIGQHEKRISYVDCFSGPWQEKSKDMHDTSVAISLEIMKSCKQRLRSLLKDVHFRALFIEKDPKAHSKLVDFLSREEWAEIETTALKGDFYQLRPEISSWCDDDSFAFFFIDPTGWKGVAEIETLKPLLQRNNSEYLINFMFDFIRRFYSKTELEQHMKAIFGEVPDISHLSVDKREDYLIQLYQAHLKQSLPSAHRRARSACVKVLYPEKDRTLYYLVYLTSVPCV